jgi:phosphoribosylanthranilate isomerase
MALKTRVFVNGVTNLHDARYCAGMGVEMVSFPLGEDKPNALSVKDFQEISQWLAGISLGAEADALISFPEGVSADCWVTSEVAALHTLASSGLPVFLRLAEAPASADALLNYGDAVAGFILPIPNPSQQALYLACIEKAPVFLAGDIHTDNVESLIDTYKPDGLVLKPGVEIKTGLNDFGLLADVLELLEVEG